MTKRVSLAGRRRIQEMAHTVSTAEAKREELLALKDAADGIDCEPKTPVAKHQSQVRNMVASLQALFEDISTRGTYNKLEYSRRMQHDMLVAEIRKQMLKLADSFTEQGYTLEKTQVICQAFVDDVRVGLASVGIHINPLYVRKLRGCLVSAD